MDNKDFFHQVCSLPENYVDIPSSATPGLWIHNGGSSVTKVQEVGSRETLEISDKDGLGGQGSMLLGEAPTVQDILK